MMFMSGGWFVVVASEAITVGNTTVALPGIGSWPAEAISRNDFGAVAEAVAMMALVILAYDQLFFPPIVARADRFRLEQTVSGERPRSWAYDLLGRTQLLSVIVAPFNGLIDLLLKIEPQWGRYGEIFTYEKDSDLFSLDDPQ
jgi:NitT/TauT family transport system permease protein